MAHGKPKTAWGRAYSAEFKRLKSAWDRTGKVAGKSVRTWRAAFKAIGAAARKHADGKAKNPVAARRTGARKRTTRRAPKRRAALTRRTTRTTRKRTTTRRRAAPKLRTPRATTKRTTTRKTTRRRATPRRRTTRPSTSLVTIKAVPKRPSRRTTTRRPARKAARERIEVVKIDVAGGGEIVNASNRPAYLRQDGSRQAIRGGIWTPQHRLIGRARRLREALTKGGVRVRQLTVLVNGKPRTRKRGGTVRYADGRLYIE
jgi:hypothetical protein